MLDVLSRICSKDSSFTCSEIRLSPFLDAVFHVVDQHGKKVTDQGLITYIQEVSFHYSQAGFFEGLSDKHSMKKRLFPLICFISRH
jgi:hypothetical protein